jgi:translation initiation factor 2B subunit (eIF-2B alpha/beta/delta family)
MTKTQEEYRKLMTEIEQLWRAIEKARPEPLKHMWDRGEFDRVIAALEKLKPLIELLAQKQRLLREKERQIARLVSSRREGEA